MTLQQMLRIFIARRWLAGGVFGGIVLAALLFSLLWPKTYVAEASVVVESKATDPVSGVEQASDLMPSYIATQVDVISSHNVALKVVEKLKLAANPDLQQAWQDDTKGAGNIRDWLAEFLLRNLQVKPSRESHVVNIDMAAHDPDAAALMANAFAESYIETSLELKTEPAQRQTAWFNEQLKDLKRTLEAAQARLSDYQRANSVSGTNDQIDIENARLAEISNQLVVAQTTMYEGQTRLKQVNEALQRGKLEEVPDILGNPMLQGLKADLVRAEGKLAEVNERYGRNHPQYLSAAAEVRALQNKLATEISAAKGAIGQSAEMGARQEGELRKSLGQQRDRILALKRQRDELDVLKRDVDGAQRSYDAGLQRASQVRLESQLDQSNIAVLNPAVPPALADHPKLLLNVLVAIIIGTMLGTATALAAELIDRRVRSGVDLVESSGLVVLAQVPSAQRASRRRRPAPRLRTSLAKA